MTKPDDERWWAPYAWWPTPVVVAILLVVVVAQPAWLAHVALFPCLALPVLLSVRGPLRGAALPFVVRLACLFVPLLVVHARNPWYDPRGAPPPVWEHVLTRAQVWAQITAWELAGLLVVDALLLTWLWAARRRRLHGPVGPRL